MPRDSFKVKIGHCANPKCGNIHIEVVDSLYLPDTALVFDPEDARRFASEIIAFLDGPHGTH